MLEQKKVYDKTQVIEYQESCIDSSEKVYLITWSPDPKELPDSDFYLQHNVNVGILADYLKCCSCGVFCVESTQLGNPHYHGWYQVSPERELARISLVKTMQRFGIVKEVTAKHIKIFSWSERGNALYYYKKDMIDSMLSMDPNPITHETVSSVNFDVMDIVGFFNKEKQSLTIKEKMSNVEFYRQFYGDTISTLK